MRKIELIIGTLFLLLASCGGSNNEKNSSNKLSNLSSSSSITEPISSSIISSSTNKNSVNSSSSIYNEPVEKEVNTPTLMLDEITGVVSWNFDENATHYNYIINDGEIKTTTSNNIKLDDKSNISVQAGNSSYVSKWSNSVTYFDTSDVFIGAKENINVYFHNTKLNPMQVKYGGKIDKPKDPSKTYYTFDNWYKDPFYREVFDFNQPIYESTIIYANFIPNELIDNVYYWLKASPKITASIMSLESSSGWHFIPLKVNNNQKSFKEFMTTITVSGATSADPAYFIIMDGFDDNPGRTYWKNDGVDFSITSDGTYNIYFSVETQYKLGSNVVHSTYEKVNAKNNVNSNNSKIETPLVNIDSENNIASWDVIENAINYEVIIDNEIPSLIKENYITLNKGSHISVRAIIDDNNISNWSIPKANINYIDISEDNSYAYLYFLDSGLPAYKIKKGQRLETPPIPIKEGFSFGGWYCDISLKIKPAFPFVVTKNAVFYPKWEFNEKDYATKQYYKLVDENNNVISGLTWNLDNYDFNEYQTEKIRLEAATKYYVKSLDDTKSWGPYSVSSAGSYIIYFSEDQLWNINTEFESNVYFAEQSMNIYFTNSRKWSGTIYAYAFNKSSGKYNTPWPGSAMTLAKTNSYGENIYTIEIDTSKYDYVIFSNGSSQTVDIPLADAYNGIGYYATSEKDGNGYKYGTYKFM